MVPSLTASSPYSSLTDEVSCTRQASLVLSPMQPHAREYRAGRACVSSTTSPISGRVSARNSFEKKKASTPFTSGDRSAGKETRLRLEIIHLTSLLNLTQNKVDGLEDEFYKAKESLVSKNAALERFRKAASAERIEAQAKISEVIALNRQVETQLRADRANSESHLQSSITDRHKKEESKAADTVADAAKVWRAERIELWGAATEERHRGEARTRLEVGALLQRYRTENQMLRKVSKQYVAQASELKAQLREVVVRPSSAVEARGRLEGYTNARHGREGKLTRQLCAEKARIHELTLLLSGTVEETEKIKDLVFEAKQSLTSCPAPGAQYNLTEEDHTNVDIDDSVSSSVPIVRVLKRRLEQQTAELELANQERDELLAALKDFGGTRMASSATIGGRESTNSATVSAHTPPVQGPTDQFSHQIALSLGLPTSTSEQTIIEQVMRLRARDVYESEDPAAENLHESLQEGLQEVDVDKLIDQLSLLGYAAPMSFQAEDQEPEQDDSKLTEEQRRRSASRSLRIKSDSRGSRSGSIIGFGGSNSRGNLKRGSPSFRNRNMTQIRNKTQKAAAPLSVVESRTSRSRWSALRGIVKTAILPNVRKTFTPKDIQPDGPLCMSVKQWMGVAMYQVNIHVCGLQNPAPEGNASVQDSVYNDGDTKLQIIAYDSIGNTTLVLDFMQSMLRRAFPQAPYIYTLSCRSSRVQKEVLNRLDVFNEEDMLDMEEYGALAGLSTGGRSERLVLLDEEGELLIAGLTMQEQHDAAIQAHVASVKKSNNISIDTSVPQAGSSPTLIKTTREDYTLQGAVFDSEKEKSGKSPNPSSNPNHRAVLLDRNVNLLTGCEFSSSEEDENLSMSGSFVYDSDDESSN